MRRRSPPDPDDQDDLDERRLFEEAMRDVRRLPAPELPAVVPGDPPPPPSRPAAEPVPAFEDHSAGEQVGLFHPSLSAPRRKALRRGSPPPERTLDLHGARAADVAGRVGRFVAASREAGARCVLLITGRGLRSGPEGPVLRGAVVALLTQEPLAVDVLAVVSAPTPLGGTGALLVLLRRSGRAEGAPER